MNCELLRLTKGSPDGYLPAASNLGMFQVADYSTAEYDDKVLIFGQNYESLFGTPRKNASSGLKRLSVVKISTKDGTSIHRAFLGSNGLKGNQVALSPNSIRLLASKTEPDYIDEVTISKGSEFLYFWNHPYHATRISMRLGMIGILATIVLSILTLCMTFCIQS